MRVETTKSVLHLRGSSSKLVTSCTVDATRWLMQYMPDFIRGAQLTQSDYGTLCSHLERRVTCNQFNKNVLERVRLSSRARNFTEWRGDVICAPLISEGILEPVECSGGYAGYSIGLKDIACISSTWSVALLPAPRSWVRGTYDSATKTVTRIGH